LGSLAYSEIYVTLGTLFARYGDLEVFDFGEEDLELDDFFSSYTAKGRRTLKVAKSGLS
jgi:hypothetical protein